MKPERHRPLSVLLIMHGSGFPNGFAATQRVRLEARAMVEAGIRVTVLLTRVSDRPPTIVNTQREGVWHGIPFEYTTGATTRSEHFAIRRWTEVRGVAGAMACIISGRRTGELSCVYLWMDYERWMPFRMLRGLCALLGVPVVVELCEPSRAVWDGASLSSGAGSREALLEHVDGFVAISRGLEEWVRSRKGGDAPLIVRVPVLVDTEELRPSPARVVRDDVFYAVGPGYPDEIAFVLDAIDMARERRPGIRVRFSGWELAEVRRPELRDRIGAAVAAGWAIVEGVLPRERLLESYGECAALLLPMKDEPRSWARYPTKLGEYLASGRPVIATRIGELAALLTDTENAFLAEPGDVRSFADAVLAALGDPERAGDVGRGGRELAERVLDYRRHSEALSAFFTAVCARRAG